MHPINDAAWSFETDQFFVGFYAEPEDLDPADSFELAEDIEAVRSGAVEWFSAAVRVYYKRNEDNPHRWLLIGSDYLGGCAYNTVREFYTGHRDPNPMHRNSSIMRKVQGDNVVICHYFPGMVREAIADVRRTVGDIKLRTAEHT